MPLAFFVVAIVTMPPPLSWSWISKKHSTVPNGIVLISFFDVVASLKNDVPRFFITCFALVKLFSLTVFPGGGSIARMDCVKENPLSPYLFIVVVDVLRCKGEPNHHWLFFFSTFMSFINYVVNLSIELKYCWNLCIYELVLLSINIKAAWSVDGILTRRRCYKYKVVLGIFYLQISYSHPSNLRSFYKIVW